MSVEEFFFTEAVLHGRLQSGQSRLLISAINHNFDGRTRLYAQGQHGDEAFGVGLFGAIKDANIRLELLGRVDKYLGRPGV